jgi:hypothetical protein
VARELRSAPSTVRKRLRWRLGGGTAGIWRDGKRPGGSKLLVGWCRCGLNEAAARLTWRGEEDPPPLCRLRRPPRRPGRCTSLCALPILGPSRCMRGGIDTGDARDSSSDFAGHHQAAWQRGRASCVDVCSR